MLHQHFCILISFQGQWSLMAAASAKASHSASLLSPLPPPHTHWGRCIWAWGACSCRATLQETCLEGFQGGFPSSFFFPGSFTFNNLINHFKCFIDISIFQFPFWLEEGVVLDSFLEREQKSEAAWAAVTSRGIVRVWAAPVVRLWSPKHGSAPAELR